jgi:hypothetical protein
LKCSLAQDTEPAPKSSHEQTQASEGCSRPSKGAAASRIRRSRQSGRGCCGAGGIDHAKAAEEGGIRPAATYISEKRERDHGSLASKAQRGAAAKLASAMSIELAPSPRRRSSV